MTLPKLSAMALLLCLAACVPAGGSYLSAEHPDATYMQEGCYGTSGPAHITFIPYHGAYLSLALYPYWREAVFGIHLPEGHTAQLLGQDIEVASTRRALVPVGHGRRGGMPYSFKSADPFGKEDYFGPLTGATGAVRFTIGSSEITYKWYEFSAKPIESMPESGTVILPALRVDDTDYPPLSLPFRKKTYFQISGFNC